MTTLVRFLRLSSILLAVILCLPTSSALRAEEAIPRPEWTAGDWWETNQHRFTVIERKDNRYEIIRTPKGRLAKPSEWQLKLYTTVDDYTSERIDRDGKVTKFSEESWYEWVHFPLSIGSRWSFSVRSSSRTVGASQRYEHDCAAAKWEELEFSGKTVRAVRIECQSSIRGVPSSGWFHTAWYAPEAKRLVRLTSQYSGGPTRDFAAWRVQPVGSPALGANVAVIMSSKIDGYSQALRGFKEVGKHQIVAEYDMGGGPEKGPSIVADVETKVKPDLILAVGTGALLAVLAKPTTIPVVYAMVLNPPSVVGDGKNVTGASMNVPVEEAIRLFKQLGIKRVGTIFTRTGTGYLVKRAESLARHEGLQLVTREITSPKEITAVLESLQDGIDGLWILPEPATLTEAALQQMLLFSYRRKIPVLGLTVRHAALGALFALSAASSEDIGAPCHQRTAPITAWATPS